MTLRSKATVRFAEPGELERLKALDPWPREEVWKQRIAAREVLVLELGPEDRRRVAGLVRFVAL